MKVDIAIVTVLPEEFDAVHKHIDGATHVPPTADAPNLYAWETGTIRRDDGRSYKVVLALAGRPTNVNASTVVSKTIDRFRPRHVLLVGIAGGVKEGLARGDVVISDVVWGYEYGKLETVFKPRTDNSYRAHIGLLTGAQRISLDSTWHTGVPNPPAPADPPKAKPGPVGSGDKLVDDLDVPFFRDVLAQNSGRLLAVEMEGAGAAHAVETAQAEGRAVGFLMVRGLSDLPPRGGGIV